MFELWGGGNGISLFVVEIISLDFIVKNQEGVSPELKGFIKKPTFWMAEAAFTIDTPVFKDAEFGFEKLKRTYKHRLVQFSKVEVADVSIYGLIICWVCLYAFCRCGQAWRTSKSRQNYSGGTSYATSCYFAFTESGKPGSRS